MEKALKLSGFARGQYSPPLSRKASNVFRRCLEIKEGFFRILLKDYQPVT
jgi:hypothetical protein